MRLSSRLGCPSTTTTSAGGSGMASRLSSRRRISAWRLYVAITRQQSSSAPDLRDGARHPGSVVICVRRTIRNLTCLGRFPFSFRPLRSGNTTPVKFFVPGDQDITREAARDFVATGGAETRGERVVPKQSRDRSGDFFGTGGVDQQAIPAMIDQLGATAPVGVDDGTALGHRFQGRHAERFRK